MMSSVDAFNVSWNLIEDVTGVQDGEHLLEQLTFSEVSF